ncbi:latent-transforming growth factor beta-binding protein 1 isoform X5 [Symphalangus syndactylus]|uniref:latent-transforming growth factor beta-binding protein 1 isoform X5 n=1 Tax=Symphalangus syndactylus TaxID=9590 RepID=UPI003007E657
MWRVAARLRAPRTPSPIRICRLTSRLPEIGCSGLTLGATGEKLLKDFAAGAASECPARSRSLSATLAGRADPHLARPAPLAPPRSPGSALPTPTPSPCSQPQSAGVWGRSAARRASSLATDLASSRLSRALGSSRGSLNARGKASRTARGGGWTARGRSRRLRPAMAGAWLRWGLLLWAGLLASSAHGRVRRITYVVHPGPGLAAGALPLSGPPRSRTFNVALNARYSRSSAAAGAPSRASPGVPSERTRRTSKPGGAALQGLRPPPPPPPPEPARPAAPGGQLHPKPGGHPAAAPFAKQGRQVVRSKVPQETQSGGGSRLQVHQKQQLQGVNVCGGRCCHGWSKAPGSQRCTKPSCVPPCQNGGMCLRPQLCVCKPGTKGKACETIAAQDTSSPVFGGQSPGAASSWGPPEQAAKHTSSKKADSLPRVSPVAQMTLTLKPKPSVGLPQQIHSQVTPLSSQSVMIHHGQTQEYVLKPKYFPAQKGILGEQSTEGSFPLRYVQDQVAAPFQLSNHTGRIKVVFTPSICKVTCTKGSCQNSCEKGNTTTLISENGHAADTLTATNFRVVICHLPCMNGGQCSSRDKCQCPPNFTGKLCQIPVHGASVPKLYQQSQQPGKALGTHVIHSTHTLPLTVTSQQGVKVKFPPNIVNIHVKHPPEASVQIHQVSRIDGPTGQKTKEAQPGQSQVSYQGLPVQKTQTIHSTYSHQQVIPHVYPVAAKTQLGRCFQETIGSQCGKALPGLSKQEDCCGTVGTSWGFNKCQKCPKKPSYHGYNQMMECLPGYKRVNNTFCQDINECQLQGVCPNGECLNTMGSYRCTCKIGFGPDPTFSSCVPDPPVISEEKGPCYRLVSSGRQCMHPLSVHLTKQLCCCSVGKAWGPHCEKCPLPGTAAFKEICPGGMGYTVSGVHRRRPIHHHVGKGPVFVKPKNTQPVAKSTHPPPLPAKEEPVEALTFSREHGPGVAEPEVATAPPEKEIPSLDQEKTKLEPGQPQLSPGVSTIHLHPQFPVVIEKTSPPVPVEVAPEASTSSASQVIAPTQVTEINECTVNPDICGAGHCINLPVRYTCICYEGYKFSEQQRKCVDIDECTQVQHLCSQGRCENTEGSFLCICPAGFMASEEGTNCIDVDECLRPDICGEGHCVNTVGAFRCEYCDSGYRMTQRGRCEDIDECLNPSTCPDEQCVNSPGSYQCVPCTEGFRGWNGQCLDVDECLEPNVCTNGDCSNLEGSYMCSCHKGYTRTPDHKHCKDIDECQQGNLCINGQCKNTEGSFRCTCGQGYQLSAAKDQCEDIDECQHRHLCAHGQCRNTEGSFQCVCDQGYRASGLGDHCEDINECLEDKSVCQRGDCINTAGSYDCTCPDGFQLDDNKTCQDINECEHPGLCGPQGECLNTEGSFHCVCQQGFSISADGRTCEDVNECELLSGVCGEAFCENVEGSFLCVCADENQEYSPMTGQCRSRTSTDLDVDVDQPKEEKKECYYNLNDASLCDNVLAPNVTKQECCCTSGAGWGDNCEIFPCPVLGTAEFTEMCPKGKGFVPAGESSSEAGGENYKDADECLLFGQEICKNGFCLNTRPGYECYCKQGTYYDPVKLQCFDMDECQDPSSCIDGQCVNTEGSYNCFCTHPMVLDASEKRCIRPAESNEQIEETDVYQDLCWEHLSDEYVCSRPLVGKQTTYTECCCLYGEAWGMQCALCPMKDSDDYAQLCNIPVTGRRQPYGRDALVDFSEQYAPEADPYFIQDRFLNSFEELQAEECGILNGCENGRCVRVQEGYTCDCFDGYHLDTAKMTCVDVNECDELNNRMSLCKNAKCINTDGSYKCLCLPGYVPSDKPNYCTPLNTALNLEKDSDLE